MTPKPSHHRSNKDRANARPLQKMETTAAADEDEITESLIETFPASDPPAWVALARVGIPKRRAISRSAQKRPR
jgi:transketolase C-terminal domain/subunit